MPKVRVTMFEEPIEVPDDEVHVLRVQGLLADDPEQPAPERPAAAAKSTPKKDG